MKCEYNEGFEEPVDAPEDGEEAAEEAKPTLVPMEAVNQKGINKFVYFVANWNADSKTHDLTNWTKIPHARPECVMAARKIKKFFTGRLDAPIESYPPFPGNEGDYLRCQIARIVAGASVCLKGVFVLPPEDDEENTFVPNEVDDEGNGGFKVLSASQLDDTDNWVHNPMYPSILKGMGRCFEPDGEPLEDEEAEAARLAAIEKGEAPIKQLSADRKISGGIPAWSARKCSPMLKEHSVSVVRSNLWPGAMCVAQGPTYANIYVGHGHKLTPNGFQPFAPPTIAAEFPEADSKEQTDERVPLPPPPEAEDEDA